MPMVLRARARARAVLTPRSHPHTRALTHTRTRARICTRSCSTVPASVHAPAHTPAPCTLNLHLHHWRAVLGTHPQATALSSNDATRASRITRPNDRARKQILDKYRQRQRWSV